MKNLKLLLPILMGVIIFSQIAKADLPCRLTDDFPPTRDAEAVSKTMDLGGISLTVGPDTPIGTNVFTARFVANTPRPTCGSTPYALGTVNVKFGIDSLVLPLSTWGTGEYAGKVYETGVPGLGAVFEIGTIAGDKFVPFETTSSTNNNSTLAMGAVVIRIKKTGPVSPGVVLGENFPTLNSFYAETPGYTGLPLRVATINFTGQLNIISASCTTPDTTVNLGSYSVADYFTGIGTSTPWMDSSLTLTNCPAFFGNYPKSNMAGALTVNESSGSLTIVDNMALKAPNTLEVSITPSTSIIDSTKGLFSIKSGSGAASGVGLQLASGNYNETSSLSLINLASYFTQSVSSTTSTNVKIPLAVRYYQTDTTVTPGKADGMVTVDILYK